MGTKMGPLKAAMRRVAPPRDHSYRDPYRLVVNLAADRKGFGVLGWGLLAVSTVTLAAAEWFLPAGEIMLLTLAVTIGAVTGMCLGMWTAGVLCHESLSSIRPLPPLDHEQLQSSKTRGANPAASEEGVRGQEPIEVALNSTGNAR